MSVYGILNSMDQYTTGYKPMKKYIVTLTEHERETLEKMISSGKSAARKLVHARILLKADSGPQGDSCRDLSKSDMAILRAD